MMSSLWTPIFGDSFSVVHVLGNLFNLKLLFLSIIVMLLSLAKLFVIFLVGYMLTQQLRWMEIGCSQVTTKDFDIIYSLEGHCRLNGGSPNVSINSPALRIITIAQNQNYIAGDVVCFIIVAGHHWQSIQKPGTTHLN